MLLLGPIPDAVRSLARQLSTDRGERLGFLLTGGPAGCSYLDADGQVWNWSAWDESVELVPDGPLKVGLVAIAAEREPGLAAWLPSRPPGASDCGPCQRSGWLPPPWPRVQCPECNGMGWVQAADAEPGAAADPAS